MNFKQAQYQLFLKVRFQSKLFKSKSGFPLGLKMLHFVVLIVFQTIISYQHTYRCKPCLSFQEKVLKYMNRKYEVMCVCVPSHEHMPTIMIKNDQTVEHNVATLLLQRNQRWGKKTEVTFRHSVQIGSLHHSRYVTDIRTMKVWHNVGDTRGQQDVIALMCHAPPNVQRDPMTTHPFISPHLNTSS